KAQNIFSKQYNTENKSENTIVKRYINLVKENYKENQKVSDYSKFLSITPGHLNDTVRLYTGKNANSFIQERILLEVKRYLLYEDKTIKEISYGLKFKNPSYFSRFVKIHTGESPEMLKNSLRKKYK
ncbi:MAG: helix-turn-helix domain-containing protein, partial [Ignavibacteria bacterium]